MIDSTGTAARLGLMRKMLLIRRFEEKIVEVYPMQDMKTPVHLCIGQEAVSAGICAALAERDYVFTTHRSHGHCLAKGADPGVLLAEFYGRKSGCCGGKGGSMHPAFPENGILGTTAIVGGGIPIAVGTALASRMRGEDRVSVVFFGDGATDEGAFHESLNFASLKKLPVLFVCENNFYATNSRLSARQPHENIYLRAEGYSIPGVHLDGNDVLEIHAAALEAVGRARRGEGPTLIECRTYRWKGHVGPDCDHEKGCRPKQELDVWQERCPIKLFKKLLIEGGVFDEALYAEMVGGIDSEVNAALEFARSAPFPEKEDLYKNVYFGKE